MGQIATNDVDEDSEAKKRAGKTNQTGQLQRRGAGGGSVRRMPHQLSESVVGRSRKSEAEKALSSPRNASSPQVNSTSIETKGA